jgi:hypothetical protein
MSQEERRQLARALAAIEAPHPMLDPVLIRRRQRGLVVMTGCCIVLAGWIVILMLKLPEDYTSLHWRGVWVGLDIGELISFAVTAWASWHGRQILLFGMIFTGTLLVCDAWFDLALDYGSSGFTLSVLSAVFAELPLAFLMFLGARRLLRINVRMVMRLEGIPGEPPSLWRMPLFGTGPGQVLPPGMRGEPAD